MREANATLCVRARARLYTCACVFARAFACLDVLVCLCALAPIFVCFSAHFSTLPHAKRCCRAVGVRDRGARMREAQGGGSEGRGGRKQAQRQVLRF